MEPENTLVDALINAGKFDTLLAAIDAAGVEAMLSSDEEYTIFAPNEDAFAKLEEVLASKNTSLEAVLAQPDVLGMILSYHVVPGKHTASDVMAMGAETMVKTALAKPESEDQETVKVTVDGQNVMVNEAKVVSTDIMADNGVIHEIDSVLMPPNLPM